MNELNQVEKTLASWTPRLPSPALKERIFGGGEASVASADISRGQFSGGYLWRLLAPGLALLLAMCMVNSRGTATFTPFITPTTSLVATVALSHPHLATYCANSAYTEHNVWPKTSFEWTNGSGYLTTALSVVGTNH